MECARRVAFIVVLGAQLPLGLLLAGLPAGRAPLAMAAATVTLGLATFLLALKLARDLDVPVEYVAGQLRAIVGSEMEVTRLEARWKMSQNRRPEEIDGVVAGLNASDRLADRLVAAIVEERRPERA